MRTERIQVADGVELAVDVWTPAADDPDPATPGTTPVPFVLAHGLASNARMWDGVAERLAAAGHPVATVDLRGHGRSSKPDGPYDVATVADDVAALIDALGFDRPIVAGQSWGGNVVVELAARHPAATRGIACVDGGWLELQRQFPEWESCRTALAPPRLVGRPVVEVERYIRSAHSDWPETGIQGTLANFEVRSDGTIAPWLTFDHHILVLRGLWEHHPFRLYPGLTVPVLLLPAENPEDGRLADRHLAIDTALGRIPLARARWIAGDHDIHAQHPAEVAAVLDEMTGDGFFA